jgi:hypothetical protein
MTVNTHPEGIPLDEHVEMGDREDLARLWQSINDLTENERFLLRRWVEGVPVAQAVVLGGAGNPTEVTLPGGGAAERFQGVALFNYGATAVNVGFSASAALGAPLYRCPPQTLLVVPMNYQDLSVAVSGAPATPAAVTVVRLRIAPFSPQLYPLNGGIEQAGLADSQRAAGVVAAPGAGAVIASIPAPGAGVYSVEVQTWLQGGAPVAADFTNMQLQHGAVAAGRLLAPTTPIAAVKERLTVAAGEAITVNAVAAATAGVNYAAAIGATQIA